MGVQEGLNLLNVKGQYCLTLNKYFVMWFFKKLFGLLQNLQTLYNEFDSPVYNSSKSVES